MRTYRKGINEEIRRGIDWSDRLIEGDTLSTSSWTVGQGLTGDDATFDDIYSDINISGGTVGTTYTVTNDVVTTEGLSYTRSFKIQVVTR